MQHVHQANGAEVLGAPDVMALVAHDAGHLAQLVEVQAGQLGDDAEEQHGREVRARQGDGAHEGAEADHQKLHRVYVEGAEADLVRHAMVHGVDGAVEEPRVHQAVDVVEEDLEDEQRPEHLEHEAARRREARHGDAPAVVGRQRAQAREVHDKRDRQVQHGPGDEPPYSRPGGRVPNVTVQRVCERDETLHREAGVRLLESGRAAVPKRGQPSDHAGRAGAGHGNRRGRRDGLDARSDDNGSLCGRFGSFFGLSKGEVPRYILACVLVYTIYYMLHTCSAYCPFFLPALPLDPHSRHTYTTAPLYILLGL